jgi:hypothetical protein
MLEFAGSMQFESCPVGGKHPLQFGSGEVEFFLREMGYWQPATHSLKGLDGQLVAILEGVHL